MRRSACTHGADYYSCRIAGQRAAPADSLLKVPLRPSRNAGNSLAWHPVSHAHLHKLVSGLAARLAAGMGFAVIDSNDTPGQHQLMVTSTAQQTAVGPQAAPDLQDAPLVLGSTTSTRPAIDGQHGLNKTPARAETITPFVEGACSYAGAVLSAIDEWISKHQPDAR